MNFKMNAAGGAFALAAVTASATPLVPFGAEPPVPTFSASYMDRSISPAADFYSFADGQWVKDNPVPADKARWGSFIELAERNSFLIHALLEDAAASDSPKGTPRREAGDFYASAMDTNRLEELRFQPIAADLRRIDGIQSADELLRVLARFHDEGVGGIFRAGVDADARQSSIYALELDQGGLSLPDRDYYLKEDFAKQRQAYREHVTKMFDLLGEKPEEAAAHADTVLDLETELAKASRSRVDLRDPDKNYNKFTKAELLSKNAAITWQVYLSERALAAIPYAIVGQPEFFDAVDKLIQSRPLSDWRVYLRWHVLHASAPFLCRAAEEENFNFFGRRVSERMGVVRCDFRRNGDFARELFSSIGLGGKRKHVGGLVFSAETAVQRLHLGAGR